MLHKTDKLISSDLYIDITHHIKDKIIYVYFILYIFICLLTKYLFSYIIYVSKNTVLETRDMPRENVV